MSANTKIEWADHTFNPWIGCTQVSPGCDHCYAKAWDRRFAVSGHAMHWGPGVARRRTSEATWQQPLKWDREAKAKGIRYRVFCASLADVFDNEVDPQWRADLFALIANTQHLDWLLLTKRVGNAGDMLNAAMRDLLDDPHALYKGEAWRNVWMGATVINQAEAERDIPKLLAIPAHKRFLSMEPLLGPVDVARWLELAGLDTDLGLSNPGLDWVIVGGESGPNARPMHPDWAGSLRDQCQAAGVAFLFKQWGEWLPVDSGHPGLEGPGFGSFDHYPVNDPGEATHVRCGKKRAGRQLDGIEHNGFPA